MKTWPNHAAALLLFVSIAPTTPALAETYFSTLNNQHTIASAWDSQHQGSATAQLTLSDDGSVLNLTLTAIGVALEDLASAGEGGRLGPIHIHNFPQGGPDFFVLQLPGEYRATTEGFTLHVRDWTIEAPAGGARVGSEVVVERIRSGNAYFGLHTSDVLCRNSGGERIACAAPATALSGHILLDPQ